MRAIVAACVVGLLLTAAPPAAGAPVTATPASVAGATLVLRAPAPDAPVGVSPEVFFDGTTYWLWTTGINGGAFTSPDGRAWQPVPGAMLPPGVDVSVVQEGADSYRMYYAEVTDRQPCSPGAKRLRYATSSDLVTWRVEPGVLIEDIGCGVPHVMKTRDGRYFAYYNLMTPERGVHVATSPDGLTWTVQRPILGDNPDAVDPAPIEMPDGTFLMLAAQHGSPTGYKGLRIMTSTDAVTWKQRPQWLVSVKGADILDPSIELVGGILRVWVAYAKGGAIDAARITDGVLTLAPKPKAGARCTKKGATSGKLVCARRDGSLVWVRR